MHTIPDEGKTWFLHDLSYAGELDIILLEEFKSFGVRRLVAALLVTPVSDFDYQSGDKSPHSKSSRKLTIL